jgi:hypothetical protein
MSTELNTPSKSSIVQAFKTDGLLIDIVDVIDRDVRNYINEKQKDYWFVVNIQHTILSNPNKDRWDYGIYMVHLVMSRVYD